MEKEKVLECVLLIDDDSTTNHVNSRLLMRSGLVKDVKVAESGQQALDYLSDFASSPPDLILLDLQMEGMNGFSFLDSYQQLPANCKARTLLALTSSASFYDLNKLKEYTDVAEHLYKPLTQDILLDVIEKYL